MSADGACLTYFVVMKHPNLLSHFLVLSSLRLYSQPCCHRPSPYLSSEHTSLWISTLFGVQDSIVSNAPIHFMREVLTLSYAHLWNIVPLVSILCENAIKATSLSLDYVLSKLECVVPRRAPVSMCEYRPYTPRSAKSTELPGTEHLEDPHLFAVEGIRRGLKPTINRMRFVIIPPTSTHTHPLAIVFSGQLYGRHSCSEYDDTHGPRQHRH